MRHNVASLLRSPTGATREAEVEADLHIDDPDVVVLEPVVGRLRFTKVNDGVLVEGTLAMDVELLCSRCLAPTSVRLELELCEQFRPTVEVPGGPPVPVAGDEEEVDEATCIDEQNILDVTEVVRQAALVAVPLHPLCSEACAGLCPVCGADLNKVSCDCTPEPDPRWDDLRAMIDEAASSES
jgi:uncharacterized protein